jgi:hypothetical protein
LILLIFIGHSDGQPVIKVILANSDQCSSPGGLAVDDSGTIYAACFNSIISINPINDNVTTLANFSQCAFSERVVVGEDGTVYASCRAGGVISIKNKTITSLATQDQCPDVTSIFVATNIYASCSSQYSNNTVIEINGGSVSTLVHATQCEAISVAANRKIGVVYVGCLDKGIISINNDVIRTIANSSQCSGKSSLSVNENTGSVYVACDVADNSVFEVDITGSITNLANLSQCKNPRDIFVSSVDNIVYVACQGGVFSVANGVVARLTNGTQCPYAFSVFVDENNGVIYATCGDGSGFGGSVISITL